jgi:5-methylcytosine-specific restriction endonuclease McrA
VRGRCWVEFDSVGPCRIFKNWHAAATSGIPLDRIREFPRRDAVSTIRQRVFERSHNTCDDCGTALTWNTAHMHEKIHRGNGGEVSLENSILVCYTCHMDIEHGNRKLHFN